ncbi:MAG: TonB-dependent receptor, partial [Bacteroidota bacterium]
SGINAQQCIISGTITNSINNEPLPFAIVVAKNGASVISTTSDTLGNYLIKTDKPGTYNLEILLTGFVKSSVFEIVVQPNKQTIINVALEEDVKKLSEVVITTAVYPKKEESPVSLRSLSVTEIKRNPGGNRDISKVIQSLPGVASIPTFRNDLIVRGGSSNENRFYLDGIEVPNINHFATQGASGGPVGMLNVDFIQDVNFYSGAFPANRGNTMSSLLDFKFKDGRNDKPSYSVTLGASDLATVYDGPISKNSTLIASYRRSYLQFLFSALGLPFLPIYNDFQFKYKIKPDTKNEFTFIGLGAIDNFKLNLDANKTEEQKYLLGTLPSYQQWNYAIGGSYKHYSKNRFTTLVISRNNLNNSSNKYEKNDLTQSAGKILDYQSSEIENKLRLEETVRLNNWKINYGAGLEDANYSNSTYNKLPNDITLDFNSKINFQKYSTFGQISRTFSKSNTTISLGARIDGNNYGAKMKNPFNQLSPRLSISQLLYKTLYFNASAGVFYQLPAYTILGYKNNAGQFTNTNIPYIRNQQAVAGLEYTNDHNIRITLEGYYKIYENYPFNLIDSISIANQGSDFGVVGNVPVDANSKGRAYGVELLVQQKLYKNFYALMAYTYGVSEFTNGDDKYVASGSDFRHTLSLTAGKIFNKNWEAGIKYRMSSGAPYTPNNYAASALISNWNVTGQAIRDYSLINTGRTNTFSQLDIRVDKKYFFKKSALNFYLDIQNFLNQKTYFNPYLTVVRDLNGQPEIDPNNANSYKLKELPNSSGTVVPTIGVIVEF